MVKQMPFHLGVYRSLLIAVYHRTDSCILKVKNDGQTHLFVDASISAPAHLPNEMFRAWMEQADKLETGEISKAEYDEWR